MPLRAFISAIEYHLPQQVLDNDLLAAQLGHWSGAKIEEKTGIRRRHLASDQECASDLAVVAAAKLFASGACQLGDIDYLLFCTQSPDFFLPTTACLLQDRLKLRTTCGALDFNLGCSGFVYGLGLAKGLIESGQAAKVLLLTAETYSKFMHPLDRSTRTLFGDAAAATLVAATEADKELIGPFVYGTDGSGANNLIVPTGGMRQARLPEAEAETDASGNLRTVNHLSMNGPEIFQFTLRVVPRLVHDLLERAGRSIAEIDRFVFHQANAYMLDHLRKHLKLPPEKFSLCLAHCGNTVSSTIPIALHEDDAGGALKDGDLVMLVGFGVGYSWGATLLRWHKPSRSHVCPPRGVLDPVHSEPLPLR